MSHPKDQEIKIRVPARLKESIKAIAHSRYTSESEIVREAILQYLERAGKRVPPVVPDVTGRTEYNIRPHSSRMNEPKPKRQKP